MSELSACLELSLKGVEPRWHFHAMISNVHPDVGKESNLVTLPLHKLSYGGSRPHGSSARGRGRQACSALDGLYSYCPWPTLGSVRQRTNYRRGHDFGSFLVQQLSIAAHA